MSYEQNIIEPSEISIDEGIFLVRLARKAIETYVTESRKIGLPDDTPEKLKRKGMAFVTIESVLKESKELRGCIGFLQPVAPLAETVINAAIAAATEDPRFPPLTYNELDNIVIEVSILSIPKPVRRIPDDIIIGKHGIIVMRGWYSGTLLPQVPIDYCWDVETFLAEGCLKAGMEPDCWLDRRTKLFVYEASIFYEESPRGAISHRNLIQEFKSKCKADYSYSK